jgi:hypothetical protein
MKLPPADHRKGYDHRRPQFLTRLTPSEYDTAYIAITQLGQLCFLMDSKAFRHMVSSLFKPLRSVFLFFLYLYEPTAQLSGGNASTWKKELDIVERLRPYIYPTKYDFRDAHQADESVSFSAEKVKRKANALKKSKENAFSAVNKVLYFLKNMAVDWHRGETQIEKVKPLNSTGVEFVADPRHRPWRSNESGQGSSTTKPNYTSCTLSPEKNGYRYHLNGALRISTSAACKVSDVPSPITPRMKTFTGYVSPPID